MTVNYIMNYKVIYTKRRTIALMVSTEGQVTVRAPKRTSLRFIEQFVGQKQDWLKRALWQQQQFAPPVKKFLEGEKFWFLGKEYGLKVVTPYHRNKLEFVGEQFVLYMTFPKPSRERIKLLFENLYKQQAKDILLFRATRYASVMGVKFNRLTIRNTISRWGSCSSLGNLNFAYRLVMAPLEIIDYVVIHELAHLVHQNHSPKFWQMVAQYYPQYQTARAWLKQKGHGLKI